ncbi:glutathione S-transferase N-terminal domain-containing protein [Marinomonas posidonica]|uniref:glutathione S-transferase N-terminal domain-containing protein n=1 Tax=Marinomonas posidonica TaxID=936476 RepID=UPI003736CD58
MKLLIKCIRNLLGGLIALIDLITRGRKLKRSSEQQAKVDEETKQLALYQFFACPFCIKTRRAIYKLNLPIEKRSASEGSPYREDLLIGGGRVKVPCLRIEENGNVEWLYESSDIIQYLEKRFS